nr:MAG: hypothetical protein [Bacteriophage sp.]
MFLSDSGALHCSQQDDGIGRDDKLIIDKHQAAQLIEVLQRWIDGEEIE